MARSQSELGRKDHVLMQILKDSTQTKEQIFDELIDYPESFVNSIYDISYDWMNKEERYDTINWIIIQITNHKS